MSRTPLHATIQPAIRFIVTSAARGRSRRAPLARQRSAGRTTSQSVIGFSNYTAPAFCYKCGDPFPWTAAALRAAEDLADEMDALSDDEKESLKKTLPDLVA